METWKREKEIEEEEYGHLSSFSDISQKYDARIDALDGRLLSGGR